MQARKQRGGGVTPRQINIIRHQPMRARKRKNAKKKKTKRKRKTENGNREQEQKGTKQRGKKKRKNAKKKGAMRDVGTGVYRRARVHGGHYASYVGLNAGDAS